jgi:hypothetical protein
VVGVYTPVGSAVGPGVGIWATFHVGVVGPGVVGWECQRGRGRGREVGVA